MPFHLEKGVLGLRLDYLSRSPAVNDYVLGRLQNGENPFEVATSININGVGTINVVNDSRADFMSKLDLLLAADPTPLDPHKRRSGAHYFDDQRRHLMPANNDNPGNRAAFAAYWIPRQAIVRDALSQAIMGAINSGREHIDYWWECSLPDGSDPTVMLVETPGAAHVFFVTDHGPVEPDTTGIRGTAEPDPDPLPI